MYCGINCQPFQDIPSITALLSAAEMLQSSHPSISGSLIKYASNLVANTLPQTDPNYQSLFQLASQSQIASPSELEKFADTLIASAQGNYSNDFYRLAYLIYGSISIQQSLPTRIMNKIHNAQEFMGSPMGSYNSYAQNTPPNSAPPNAYPAYPSIFQMSSQGIPSPANLNGPPSFNQSSQNIPQPFTAGAPPVFTPPGQTTQNIPSNFYASGPPAFSPYNQPASHPPHGFNPHPLSQSTNVPQFSSSFNQSTSMASSAITSNSLKMTEMAQNALNSGNHNMAFSLLLGAILELQKPC